MKRVSLLIIAITVVAIVLCACSAPVSTGTGDKAIGSGDAENSTKTAAQPEPELYFPQPNERSGGIIADFASDAFSGTIRDLYERSDLVVLADVTSEDQWISEPSELQNAESGVVCVKVYKGDADVNDSITVHETGYRYDGYDASFAGEPILRKGMKTILFLTQEDPETHTRAIVGCFQGKVFLDENDVCYPYSYYSEYDREHGGNTVLCPYFEDFKEPIPLAELEELMK